MSSRLGRRRLWGWVSTYVSLSPVVRGQVEVMAGSRWLMQASGVTTKAGIDSPPP